MKRFYSEALRLWRLSPDHFSLVLTQQIREREIEPIAEALEKAARSGYDYSLELSGDLGGDATACETQDACFREWADKDAPL